MRKLKGDKRGDRLGREGEQESGERECLMNEERGRRGQERNVDEGKGSEEGGEKGFICAFTQSYIHIHRFIYGVRCREAEKRETNVNRKFRHKKGRR